MTQVLRTAADRQSSRMIRLLTRAQSVDRGGLDGADGRGRYERRSSYRSLVAPAAIDEPEALANRRAWSASCRGTNWKRLSSPVSRKMRCTDVGPWTRRRLLP